MSIARPHSAPCDYCDTSLDFDPDIMEELEKGFTRLRLSNATTPLRKFLYKRVFRLLENRHTPFGATLLDVVRVGLRHHDAPIGAYAPDQYSYDTFKLLFDPIIKELHFRFDSTDTHPPTNWGDWTRIENLDPDENYIVSTRVRCSRNLEGFRFTPTMAPCEFEEVESTVMKTLQKLPWEYKGIYSPLRTLSARRQRELELDHCFFPEGTKFERTGNISRYWPAGRGIFVNRDRTFAVWINEKDHIRVICLEDSGDLHTAYQRLAVVMPVLDRRLNPARDNRLGFLTVSPSNVGTALRISVFMRLPHSPLEEVHKLARVYHIDVTCLCGVQDNLYCMSNMRRLGFTEYALTREFNLGIKEMIKLEKHHELLTPKGLKNNYSNESNESNEGEEDPDGRSMRSNRMDGDDRSMRSNRMDGDDRSMRSNRMDRDDRSGGSNSRMGDGSDNRMGDGSDSRVGGGYKRRGGGKNRGGGGNASRGGSNNPSTGGSRTPRRGGGSSNSMLPSPNQSDQRSLKSNPSKASSRSRQGNEGTEDNKRKDNLFKQMFDNRKKSQRTPSDAENRPQTRG